MKSFDQQLEQKSYKQNKEVTTLFFDVDFATSGLNDLVMTAVSLSYLHNKLDKTIFTPGCDVFNTQKICF